MLHVPGHLLLGVAAFAVTLGFRSLTVNRLVKRKLRLSLVLLVAFAGASSLLLAVYPFLLGRDRRRSCGAFKTSRSPPR